MENISILFQGMLVNSLELCQVKSLTQNGRHFHSIKTLSKLTSHHHPNNVIFNLWIRLQPNKILNEKQNVFENDKSMIKEINSSLPPLPAFLETMIPDFVTECGVWWKENETGIEFFDIKNNDHYRSSSIVSEEKYLQNMWQICVNNKNTNTGQKVKRRNQWKYYYNNKSFHN